MSDKRRSRIRKSYQKMVDKYGATIRPMVRSLVLDKWQRLSNRNYVTTQSTVQSRHIDPAGKVASRADSVIVVKPDYNDDVFGYFGPNTEKTKEKTAAAIFENFRVCLVTGVSISKQDERTRFLSKSTLIDLYDHNPALFESLATRYLPVAKRSEKDIERQAYFIAHNIRNEAHNPAQNLRRRVVKSLSSSPLFPGYKPTLSIFDRQLLEQFKNTPYEIMID